jgi:hypothetical protein
MRAREVSERAYKLLLAGTKWEFRSGGMFERFITSAYVRQGDFRKIPKVPFSEAFRLSIETAKKNGFDETGLSSKRCYINRLYSEVKAQLPTQFQKYLHVYVTIGQPLDLHGIDIVFILLRPVASYVGVDLTIDPFNKHSDRVIFSQYDLSDERTILFAKRVAEELLLARHMLLHKN